MIAHQSKVLNLNIFGNLHKKASLHRAADDELSVVEVDKFMKKPLSRKQIRSYGEIKHDKFVKFIEIWKGLKLPEIEQDLDSIAKFISNLEFLTLINRLQISSSGHILFSVLQKKTNMKPYSLKDKLNWLISCKLVIVKDVKGKVAVKFTGTGELLMDELNKSRN